MVAEIGPARRRTGADLRSALEHVPPPDERFADDIAAALAQISAEGTIRGQALDPGHQRPDRLRARHD